MAETNTQDDIGKLTELLDGIRFTMFTTRVEGRMRARPMTTLDIEDGHRLWFLTSRDSELTEDVRADPTVGLMFSDDDSARYVSISGTAALRDDPARIEALWNPLMKAWFKDQRDPTIQLLEVDVDVAEYWDGEHSRLVRLFGIVRAAVTGQEYDAGEQGEVVPGRGSPA